MKRRKFIAALGLAAAWPSLARGQQHKKLARVGFLMTGSVESYEARSTLDAFKRGLSERGYVEGQNILFVVREAHSEVARFPALANELVQLNLDVILASNSIAAHAVRQATAIIPIVVPVMGDPVGDGLVISLARPGGNITGLTFLGPKLVAKRLAQLREALPTVSRVAVLWQPGAYSAATMDEMIRETKEAAVRLGLSLEFVPVRFPDDFDGAFSAIDADKPGALFTLPSPMLFAERRRVIAFGEKLRLPVVSVSKEFVTLGGLMSYGTNVTDLFRLSAAYVDKILKGTQPADLPVEQPIEFELCINLKTAKDLGIEIPAALLAQANDVIE
jgi:ABC-type uncharacterized transport system substrate-binding protein